MNRLASHCFSLIEKLWSNHFLEKYTPMQRTEYYSQHDSITKQLTLSGVGRRPGPELPTALSDSQKGLPGLPGSSRNLFSAAVSGLPRSLGADDLTIEVATHKSVC